MNFPFASLFVSTYEMPRHLELVCAGLLRQTSNRFEVLFCDDGSGEETARVIEVFSKRFEKRFPGRKVQHIWHENRGFRKCRILNRAVHSSQGEVFIFLDGDCIPHRDFIKDHLALQEEGKYLAGRRMELGRSFSESLTPEIVEAGFFDRVRFPLVWSALQGETAYLNRSVRVPWGGLRRIFGMESVVDLKGCNYSVSRKALESINGFDESYEGYGREDTDVELRLQNYGLKIKSLKGLALQYHIWHPRREFTPANDDRLMELKKSRRIRCQKGLIELATSEMA